MVSVDVRITVEWYGVAIRGLTTHASHANSCFASNWSAVASLSLATGLLVFFQPGYFWSVGARTFFEGGGVFLQQRPQYMLFPGKNQKVAPARHSHIIYMHIIIITAMNINRNIYILLLFWILYNIIIIIIIYSYGYCYDYSYYVVFYYTYDIFIISHDHTLSCVRCLCLFHGFFPNSPATSKDPLVVLCGGGLCTTTVPGTENGSTYHL